MTKAGMVNVNEVAKEAALEAIKIYKQQEKEKRRKTSLHNMGLLMDHYLDFVEHYEKIKYRAADIEEYFDNMDIYVNPDDEDEQIRIESIKRSKIRTLIIITQIQSGMSMLKAEMEAKNEIEKYMTLKLLYMDPRYKNIKFNQRIKKVAEEIKCHEATVRRWNNESLSKLSVKLFGVDGLRLDV